MLDRIEADRSHSQRILDGEMQHLGLEALQQAQNLHLFPLARFALACFQQSLERGESLW